MVFMLTLAIEHNHRCGSVDLDAISEDFVEFLTEFVDFLREFVGSIKEFIDFLREFIELQLNLNGTEHKKLAELLNSCGD